MNRHSKALGADSELLRLCLLASEQHDHYRSVLGRGDESAEGDAAVLAALRPWGDTMRKIAAVRAATDAGRLAKVAAFATGFPDTGKESTATDMVVLRSIIADAAKGGDA